MSTRLLSRPLPKPRCQRPAGGSITDTTFRGALAALPAAALRRGVIGGLLAIGLLSIAGCGATKSQEASDQLTLSAAVDNSIAAIDFRPLAGQKVYFDDRYIRNIKPTSFVNADYVISSMRQQMMAAGCLLQDEVGSCDVVVEGRIGTMGADEHRVTYGIPENNVLGVAASVLAPAGANLPAMPEIAVARRDAREGAAKIAAFAYLRETREPIWQSGLSKSIATSQNTWVMGVGPFQGGSIRDSSKEARQQAKTGGTYVANPNDVNGRPPVNYSAQMQFDHGRPATGRPLPLAVPPPQEVPLIATRNEMPEQIGDDNGEAAVVDQPADPPSVTE